MRIALFSCHTRRPRHAAIGEVFQPIWIGGEIDLQGRWLTDRDAEAPRGEADALQLHLRLARRHAPHLAFIGVEQENRWLLLDPTHARDSEARHPRAFALRRAGARDNGSRAVSATPDEIADHLAQRTNLLLHNRRLLEDWLEGRDIVVGRGAAEPSVPPRERTDWQAIMERLEATPLWMSRAPHLGADLSICVRRDAVLMRSRLFVEFVQLWSDVASGIDDMALRRASATAEVGGRLLALWIAQLRFEDPSLRVTELPLLVGSDQGAVHLADRRAPMPA